MSIYNHIYETLPNNLRFLRKSKSLTQEEMGAKLNISRKKYSKIENGRSLPDLICLCQLSKFFSVEIDRLVKDRLYE